MKLAAKKERLLKKVVKEYFMIDKRDVIQETFTSYSWGKEGTNYGRYSIKCGKQVKSWFVVVRDTTISLYTTNSLNSPPNYSLSI